MALAPEPEEKQPEDTSNKDTSNKDTPWKLASSKLSEGGDIRSMIKNTFIEHPDTSTMHREGARRRTSSVPKDMGSTKNNRDGVCYHASDCGGTTPRMSAECVRDSQFQHLGSSAESATSASSRKITVTRHGYGLGLDVSCEGEFLVIEDVGPGPVELWNLTHPGEALVQAGDRIIEVNGISGDADAMLCAVQASDVVELTLEFSAHITRKDEAPSISGLSDCSSLIWDASSAPCPVPAEFWQLPGSQMQTAPEFASPCHAPKVFIHSGPPKVFVHSGPPPMF